MNSSLSTTIITLKRDAVADIQGLRKD